MKIAIRTLALAVLVVAAASRPAAADPPAVGTKAPAVSLPSQEGGTVTLDQNKGKWIVLYFYPKDFTSGCTLEAQNFQRDHAKYEKANTVVLGVSLDSVDSHKGFCAKEGLNFKLLADTAGEVTKAYGSEANVRGQGVRRPEHVPDRPLGSHPEGLREGEPGDAQRGRAEGPRDASGREVARPRFSARAPLPSSS